MKKFATNLSFLLILFLFVASLNVAAVNSQSPNWSGMRGVAYRSATNSYVCFQGLPSCDAPTVAPPNVAFVVYKSAGFNFARISLDWFYMEQNPSAFQSILTADANACDANGIYCYYLWGANPGNFVFPTDVRNVWPAPGCNNPCFTGHFSNDDTVPTGSGTPYDGQPLWQAAWNGLIKPTIQLLDSHPSTVGYSVANEPGSGWTSAGLTAYYHYMAQQMRTLTSKAFIFQASAGGSGGGGSATIQQLAPSGYSPYVFEIHNYQGEVNYNPYPSVVTQCQAAGCAGVLLGEWGGKSTAPAGYATMTQYITDELNAVKQNSMANQWFDFTGTNPTTGALTPTLMLLSQLDAQILGGGSQTTTATSPTSTSSLTTTTKTSTVTSSTTSTTSTTTRTITSSTGLTTTTSSTRSTITTSSSTISTTSSSSSTRTTSSVSTSSTSSLTTIYSSYSTSSISSTVVTTPGSTSTTSTSSTSTTSATSTSTTASSTASTSSTTSLSTTTNGTSTTVPSNTKAHKTHSAHDTTSVTTYSADNSTPVKQVYLFPATSTLAMLSGATGLAIAIIALATRIFGKK